jgi:arsenical pump membrane protein
MQALALVAFLITILLVLWRPGGIHEAVPALFGALGMFVVGLIDRHDVLRVMAVVGNSATTIIATFVMASVLEGAGFFRWATERLIENAQGSRRRLFHLCLAFMTCLTLFLNNDGSILLGMPVILGIVRRTPLPKRTQFIFLIASGLIASATSSIVGVSNIANLEAMALVGISLIEHLREIWFPGLVGICVAWYLLDRCLGNEPLQEEVSPTGQRAGPGPHPPTPEVERLRHAGLPAPHRFHLPPHHPPRHHEGARPPGPGDGKRLRQREAQRHVPWMIWTCVAVIVLVRIGFFVASAAHIPNAVVAVAGALVMLGLNAISAVVNPREAIRKAPWAILGFAFGLDLMVFGLRNAALTGLIASWIAPFVQSSVVGISFLPGALVGLFSASLNNHPALIVGSLSLLEVPGLSREFLNIAYAGVVLGSDLGGLLTPVGTLACLLWFHFLRQNGMRYIWSDYLKISLVIIPISFLASLSGLFLQALLTVR